MGWFFVSFMAAALAGVWGVAIDGARPFGYVVAVFASLAFIAFCWEVVENSRAIRKWDDDKKRRELLK